MTQPEKIVELLISSGQARAIDFIGCTEDQILLVELKCHVTLPRTYKHFLSVMGCGAGRFLADCSWKLADLPHAQDVLAKKLQAAENPVKLTKTIFVFLECSAAEILYFDTKDGDDPPVYLIESPVEEPVLWSKSFSDWLTRAANEVTKMTAPDVKF